MPIRAASRSRVTPTAWSALYLRSADAPLDTNGYLNFTFYVHGGTTGGQTIQVVAVIGDTPQPGVRVAIAHRGCVAEDHGAARRARRRQPHRREWLLGPAGLGRRSSPPSTSTPSCWNPAFRPRRRRRSTAWPSTRNRWSTAGTTGAGPRVNTGEHDDGAHRLQCDRRDGRCLRGAVSAARRPAHRRVREPEVLDPWRRHRRADPECRRAAQRCRRSPRCPSVRWRPEPGRNSSFRWRSSASRTSPTCTGLWLQENSGATQPTFYVDDVHLEFAPPPSLVNVTVNPKQRIRKVDRRMFGINAAVWDGAYASPNTPALLTELNNQALRFPGGSLSDVYHWQTNMSERPTDADPSNGPRASMTSSRSPAPPARRPTSPPTTAPARRRKRPPGCTTRTRSSATTSGTGKSATRTTAAGKRTTTPGRTTR